MKICVTSRENSLEAEVDPRFGRCEYFVIYDTEKLNAEFVYNESKDGMGGVGIQAGQLMADKGVGVVLTGNVGPNAFNTLKAAGISVVSGASGKVIHVIDKYTRGELSPAEEPSVDPHFGSK